jgi:hypothetical protein
MPVLIIQIAGLVLGPSRNDNPINIEIKEARSRGPQNRQYAVFQP